MEASNLKLTEGVMWDSGQDITSLPRVRTILDIMKQINIQLKVENRRTPVQFWPFLLTDGYFRWSLELWPTCLEPDQPGESQSALPHRQFSSIPRKPAE